MAPRTGAARGACGELGLLRAALPRFLIGIDNLRQQLHFAQPCGPRAEIPTRNTEERYPQAGADPERRIPSGCQAASRASGFRSRAAGAPVRDWGYAIDDDD